MKTIAWFLSHNGLGDNLYSIGAIRYLLQFYDVIYFFCMHKYLDNVVLFFSDIPSHRLVFVPLIDEFKESRHLIHTALQTPPDGEEDIVDVFVCGLHKEKLPSRISYSLFLNSPLPPLTYHIDYDTLTTGNYNFISHIYADAHLNLNIFFDWWKLPSSPISKNLLEKVKSRFPYIVFLHTVSSDHCRLCVDGILQKYLHEEGVILISSTENVYSEIESEKGALAQELVMQKVAYYHDIIAQSDEIYIIDSCFTGIVLPMVKTGQLKADPVRIIERSLLYKTRF